MRQAVLKQASKYAKAHQRRRRWHKAVSCLAAVVVFCTTYALILPAITLEQDKCDIPEHVHDESCYELVGGHIHTDACYTAQRGELICTKEERPGHIHTDACYTARQGELICTEEERPGHQHTDACYTEYTQLICDLPEGEDHQHTDECYETVRELTCGLEEDPGHQHTDECYETILELTCGLEEDPGHQHTDACYAWEPVLTCGKEEFEGGYVLTCGLEEGEIVTTVSDTPVCGLEEHTHTLACYADPTADVETAQIWERSLKSVELTGIWREDVIAVAKTQLGYQESAKNYIVLEDGETLRGYTRYGAWYGDPYGDWCAMFASFVLNYAEVEGVPLDANCQHWIETLSEEEHDLYRPADEYLPQPGDLIFFDFDIEDEEEKDEEPTADHVGLVAEIINDEDGNPAQIKTIEGNSSDKVQYVTYELDDPAILGYGQLPEQEPEDEEPIEEPAEQFVLTAESEDGIAVTVTGDPESLPYPVEEITLSVQPVTDEDVIALWKQTLEEAGENAEEAFLLDIALLHDGEEIEPTGPVQVTFEGVETGDNDELTVFHVDAENEETEDMNAVVDEAGTVVLDTDHFSVYGGLVSVSGPSRTPQPGEYIYLDVSQVATWRNGGYQILGFYYKKSGGVGVRQALSENDKVSEYIYRIKVPNDIDMREGEKPINFFRLKSNDVNGNDQYDSWIKDGLAFEAGKNCFQLRYGENNHFTGAWTTWYVESLAGKTMAFENKTGNDLNGVTAIFYNEAKQKVESVTVGEVQAGQSEEFHIPDTYGSYVQFVDGQGNILGDTYSNFLGEGSGETGVESFVYNETTKYCYKYKGGAADSTWGVPGDGTAISTANELKQFLEQGGSGSYYLANDIAYNLGSISVTGDKVLNLNGKTITTGMNSQLFTVGSSASLTITDSVDVQDEKITETDSGDMYGYTATLSNNVLTYYVTESTPVVPDTPVTGAESVKTETKETLVTHRVDFSHSGSIVSNGSSDQVIFVLGGTLNMEGGVLSSNSRHAIYMSESSGGTINLSGGLIKGNDNSGDDGSGVGIGSGTFNMTGGYIAGGKTTKDQFVDNKGTGGGGGVYLKGGVINMSGGVIAANQAYRGGGIYVHSGTLNLSGTAVVSGNEALQKSGYNGSSEQDKKASYDGGGIYMEGGTLNLSGNAYVTNNHKTVTDANDQYDQHGGGGIALDYDSSMNMTGGYVTGNRSEDAGGGIFAGYHGSAKFNMTGGIIASNYAVNGEGGGLRIGGGTDGMIDASSGGKIYITNNTSGTTKDWGGGGIFVQQNGDLNITDVLITNNHANGFGGGVGGCPTGDVSAVNDRGSAIFDNTASCLRVSSTDVKKQDEVFKNNFDTYHIRDWTSGAGELANLSTRFYNDTYTNKDLRECQDFFCTKQDSITNAMLGEGSENWTGPDFVGTIPDVSMDTLFTSYYGIEFDVNPRYPILALTAHPKDEAKKNAVNAASVFISGNKSGTHGGGIMSNGTLDMGKTVKNSVPVSLKVNASKLFEKNGQASGMTENQFSFVLLNKVPTWSDEEGWYTYDDQDVVQRAGNTAVTDADAAGGTKGTISFGSMSFISDKTYTYYLVEEKDEGNSDITPDSALYRIDVVVGKNETFNENKTVQTTRYKIEGIKVTKDGQPYPLDINLGDGLGEVTVDILKSGDNATFTNKEIASYALPSTGGAGTTPYTTGGLLLMVSASALLLYNHQKRRKEATASS